jgi:hypothetical protein
MGIGKTKMKLLMMIGKMEELRLVMVRMGRRDDGGSKSTRFRNPFAPWSHPQTTIGGGFGHPKFVCLFFIFFFNKKFN